ncbi:SHOCT domain-containing protein [Pseudomonas sp. P66]|uniref:SHOCT domain-containing protein n=2 Tax=Pseudomonas TaxID=286 RepID=A0AB35X2D8_9PSED|nr:MULTISPECIES: SHOCT domain-containing protein [Pseudomonas]MBM5459596.1 SHOCT domain-containing protein [Pseudomonas arcuscaelestis]MEE1869834.1 SHOCT domain-containing protein [Pseudomonas sp. 120P]MEE1960828.1 SHOCT domain-containing protein [Pseudomonas sp. 119P]
MENTPLTSSDHSKILVFALLMLPIIGFFVGVAPAVFLLFGVFMMKKNNDFSHISTAVRNAKIYLYIALAIAGVCTAWFATTLGAYNRWDRQGEEFIVSCFAVGIVLFYLFILNALFYKPLLQHKTWVADNGIFSNKPKTNTHSSDIDIIKGERMKSFSVADELIKWAKLKEDGHISEQEYNDARNKLLQRE